MSSAVIGRKDAAEPPTVQNSANIFVTQMFNHSESGAAPSADYTNLTHLMPVANDVTPRMPPRSRFERSSVSIGIRCGRRFGRLDVELTVFVASSGLDDGYR